MMWAIQISHLQPIPHRPILPTPIPTKSRAAAVAAVAAAANHPQNLPTPTTTTTTFVTIPVPTTRNNNRLIQLLCRKGNLIGALQVLSQEAKPTKRTFELLIQCCSAQNSVSDAVVIHRHIRDHGFETDSFLGTKFINLYVDLGRLDYARKVFDEMTERSVFVWNAMFRGLTLAGNGVEALEMFREFNGVGIENADRFSYMYALKACVVCEHEGSLLNKGKEIHGCVVRRGFEWRVHVMTTLLDMYARFGRVIDASNVFEVMPEKNVVSWSVMIACYAKNGMAFEALDLFHSMMVETYDDGVPNPVTMVSVLQACAVLASLEQGKLIHGFILRRGLDSIVPVNNALITMYARCGALRSAQLVFDLMNKRDVISWNSLISSYGIHGSGSEAIQVFKRMITQGTKPSPVSFIAVLGACSHTGLVNDAKGLFDSMANEHRISPGLEHYACMVDILGRANKLDEAASIIEVIPVEPGPKVWGALLGSCRIHTNVELAERASSRLFELEPYNAGNYVVLADIYAGARMWDDVKRVMELLEARGLQKVPGCSRIEVRRKIHTFRSTNEPNPELEPIQDALIKVSKEMKERGYVPNTNLVLYDVDEDEKERILLGHAEKVAVAFGLLNMNKGETMRITKNLRLCEDCHTFTKFISKFENRDILVRDANRFHHFHHGICSCGDYW